MECGMIGGQLMRSFGFGGGDAPGGGVAPRPGATGPDMITRPSRHAPMSDARERLPATVRIAEGKLAAAKAKHQNANARLKRLEAQRTALPTRCLEYLRSLPADIAIEAHTAPVKPTTQSVEEIRREIADLRADIETVR